MTLIPPNGLSTSTSPFLPIDMRLGLKDEPLSMENRVCSSAEVQNELNVIIASGKYQGNIIPVYTAHTDDNDSTIIPLNEYESRRLRGALIGVKASITYQHLAGRSNVDNYYADIHELWAISRPPPPPSSSS
ncbi:hypothetical protein C8Q79DRAFT_953608 [Trametes meyenii]|nr:hypothetical protein C8Q79DRAFT_953608 [Trametes meyenii]